MGYFLGLDASTQSLSAVVINTTSGKIILEKSVNFGDNLPQYDCPNGFIENDDPLLRHSDPMMWLAALDLLLQRCEASGFDWSKIDGVSGSGDNPCSLIGMGATEPGTAVISLGTSDTFFAAMNHPVSDPNGYGHVFGNPANGFMCLLCFKNGSLAREKIRNRFAMDWTQFEKAILQDTLAGNNGNILFPYFESEITPLIMNPGVKLFGSEDFENWQDAEATVRAIVEAQAMSMKIHSSWISEAPTTIRITGGASCDDGITRVFADVFNVNIQRLLTSNSAGLGAALMAAQAVTKANWNDLHDVFSKANPAIIEPNARNSAVYDQILPEFGRRLQDAFDLD